MFFEKRNLRGGQTGGQRDFAASGDGAFIGSHQGGRGQLPVLKELREEGLRGESRCQRNGKQLLGVAAVHVHGDGLVDSSGFQRGAGPGRGQALAGLVFILPAVGQVGQQRSHLARAFLLQRMGQQQQREQLLIRRRNRTQQNAVLTGDGGVQGDVQFAVLKAAGLELPGAGPGGNASRAVPMVSYPLRVNRIMSLRPPPSAALPRRGREDS